MKDSDDRFRGIGTSLVTLLRVCQRPWKFRALNCRYSPVIFNHCVFKKPCPAFAGDISQRGFLSDGNKCTR